MSRYFIVLVLLVLGIGGYDAVHHVSEEFRQLQDSLFIKWLIENTGLCRLVGYHPDTIKIKISTAFITENHGIII